MTAVLEPNANAVPAIVYHTDEEIRAIVQDEAAAIPLMGGRPSDEARDHYRANGLTSIIPRKNEKSWKVRPDRDVLRTLRIVMDRDPDVSKAVENFILLVGQGYEKTAYRRKDSASANAQQTEDPAAQNYLDELDRRIGSEYGGGMDAVISVLVKTLLHYGAVAVELELSENLSEVLDVHPVRPDRISFKRDPETGRLRRGVMTSRASNVAGADSDGFLELPSRQFRYIPFHPHVDEPYGYPPFLSALAAVFFKVELLEDAKMAIHVNGHGRLDVTIDLEKLQAGMPERLRAVGSESKARDWVKARIAEVSANFKQIASDQSLFHGSDVTTGDIAPKALPDLRGIMTVIDNQVIAGTKQLPILLGRNEGATTTHATVQWQLFAKQVDAFTRIIKRIIEWVHMEALAVAGFASYSVVDFDPVRASDELEEQNVQEKKIANWDAMVSLGWADDEEGAMDTIGHPPVGERVPAPVPAVPSPSDVPAGGADTTQQEATNGGENLVQQPGTLQRIPGRSAENPGVNGGELPVAGRQRPDYYDLGPQGHGHAVNGPQRHNPRDGQPGGTATHGNNDPGGTGRRAEVDAASGTQTGPDQVGPVLIRHNRPGDHPSGNGFKNAGAGDAWAEKSTKSWADGLSGDQTAALTTMKGDGFADINKKLRKGGKLTKSQQKTVDDASSAISGYTASRNIVTYRGVSSAALGASLDKIKAGHTFTDAGFGSTTFNPAISGEFVDRSNPAGSGIQMKVYVKKGSKVAYMESFDTQGFGESEMLLPPGTKYRVLRVGEDNYGRPVIAVEVE